MKLLIFLTFTGVLSCSPLLASESIENANVDHAKSSESFLDKSIHFSQCVYDAKKLYGNRYSRSEKRYIDKFAPSQSTDLRVAMSYVHFAMLERDIMAGQSVVYYIRTGTRLSNDLLSEEEINIINAMTAKQKNTLVSEINNATMSLSKKMDAHLKQLAPNCFKHL